MRARTAFQRGHPTNNGVHHPRHRSTYSINNNNNNTNDLRSVSQSQFVTSKTEPSHEPSSGHSSLQRRRRRKKKDTSIHIRIRRSILHWKVVFLQSSNFSTQQEKLLFHLVVFAFLLVTFVRNIGQSKHSGHGSNRNMMRLHHTSGLQTSRPESLEHLMQIPIVLNNNEFVGKSFFPLPNLLDEDDGEFEQYKYEKDFGGLNIEFLEEGESRTIIADPNDMEGSVHTPILDIRTEDDVDENWMYLAHDDLVRAQEYAGDDDEDANEYLQDREKEQYCRRTNFHQLIFPNCNTIHEEAFVLDNLPTVLANGGYRQGYILERSPLIEDHRIMFKQNLISLSFKEENYEFTRMDALVSERLTSSPQIADIYGHCGLSILAEFFEGGVLEQYVVGGEDGAMSSKDLGDNEDVKPQNDLTIEEKVSTALDMAESIATLHGHSGGVMVHNDIKPDQWLIKEDGTIKLNDFNRAEIMLYDVNNSEYCRYHEGPGNGDFRSPEEYHDYPLNEKIDTYSMGNNIYVLLTGLYPFYGRPYETVMGAIAGGEKPFVDERYRTRSVEEAALVKIMERCWEYNPDDRASIFEVVEFLRNLQKEMEQRKIKTKGIEEHENL